MTITPASIRNLNPGAMEPGPSSRKFGSRTHEVLRWKDGTGKLRTNKIATFQTAEHGAAAMFDLLERRYTGKTLKSAVSTWCGGYWPDAYAAHVSQATGLDRTSILTRDIIRDADKAIVLCKAMAKIEAGREFPLDDAGWRTGHEMAFASAAAPSPTTENDVPFPKPEAQTRQVVTDIAVGAAKAAPVVGAVGVTATVPAPPTAVTDNLSNTESWFSIGERVSGLVKGIATGELGSLIALAGVLIAMGAVYLVKARDA